ncbi:uncharacterized protein KNAG_0M01680 [Huiozyma naganishii CBS 8797]|uniref:Reverse transcriptase Ty1/copia-type domain-containing protein n=1 Tax=Huiozyma naganishii (strain ATCC MYA-139 / BCRC 22969 / CBS 8797 / KCTC 17520 / NBRC 10181 / NCYC 3082 / Yp74L-3) TaxID=1071383 RepID=J7SBG3_HUIN7|nr:hypothetical protein KNAG_0M01680 [Kazachstania naganishii CBS 8797]CCK73021.1 hypothetical protein KNAG_0M01680 [Kazachstania naganishii CBS 8797]
MVNKIRSIFYKEAITNNKNIQANFEFIKAYQKELDNLVKMKVYNPKIKIPKGEVHKDEIEPINTTFNIRRDKTRKARIVCRGDLQSESSYSNIETSILNMNSLKMLLILANNNNLRLRTLDINHAFLYASIDENFFITHPNDSRMVTPLHKALYGLKQSPKRWNDTLKRFMNSIGMHDSVSSHGLYVSKNGKVMIAAYVNDCITAGQDEKDIDSLVSQLQHEYSFQIIGTMENGKLDTNTLGLD